MKEFEDWIKYVKSGLFLDKHDHPSLWCGSNKEVLEWENNPYSLPWTAGAYESWKHLKGDSV